MDKNDFLRKFTSRKFWAAIASFVAALLVAFNVDNLTTEQVILVVTACGSLVTYVFGEGLTDRANAGGREEIETYEITCEDDSEVE